MPKFHTNRFVKHSATQMFALVADVEKYPEFVPFCAGLKILKTHEINGLPAINAVMKIAYKGLSEQFTSQVVLDEANHKIDVTFISGPVKHLSNHWQFTPQDEQSCVVDFKIEYSFKNPILALAMNAAFQAMFGNFAQSFEKRADEMYGQSHTK